ncbi:MAG: thiamine pyrophosphate-dependent enzyme, partial [Pseudomonadota bacterium]
MGHHLATGSIAAVFMQNSGLGNAVNPLTSLAHPDIYGVPMLLIIGWRGEVTDAGQIKDEPQHVFQGRITPAMLDVLDVPYRIIGRDESRSDISEAALAMLREAEHGKPAALVVRKGTFDGKGVSEEPSNLPTREAAIAEALRHLAGVPLVATTGKIGREVYELQQADDIGGPSFLTVGGMGHAAMIAAGIARNTDGKVACFDGDGAVLMHTGSLGTSARCANLIHLVFNNRVHDSVGGN